MIRQAFTEENFRKIYDFENRKGINLEARFFPQLQKETDSLKRASVSFRKLKAQRGSLALARIRGSENALIR